MIASNLLSQIFSYDPTYKYKYDIVMDQLTNNGSMNDILEILDDQFSNFSWIKSSYDPDTYIIDGIYSLIFLRRNEYVQYVVNKMHTCDVRIIYDTYRSWTNDDGTWYCMHELRTLQQTLSSELFFRVITNSIDDAIHEELFIRVIEGINLFEGFGGYLIIKKV